MRSMTGSIPWAWLIMSACLRSSNAFTAERRLCLQDRCFASRRWIYGKRIMRTNCRAPITSGDKGKTPIMLGDTGMAPLMATHRAFSTESEEETAENPNKTTIDGITPGVAVTKMLRSITLASLISAAVLDVGQTVPPAYAYSDAASQTVEATIERLKEAAGDRDKSFAAYEALANIITEGAGVGGAQSYEGVTLNRGLVADEDTSVYNPGLSLLTETEKDRLVEAVIQVRKTGFAKGTWSEGNEVGYDFLKSKLDPFHVQELRGYLGVFPFVTFVAYAATLFVQRNARGLFPVAYLVGVLVIFAPILGLIIAGP